MGESDYLTLTEAARLLRVSRWTLYRRVEEARLTIYESPANRRVKLVKRGDIEVLMRPRPIQVDEGKVAA
jgi:excisionase family DNA binding protein